MSLGLYFIIGMIVFIILALSLRSIYEDDIPYTLFFFAGALWPITIMVIMLISLFVIGISIFVKINTKKQ